MKNPWFRAWVGLGVVLLVLAACLQVTAADQAAPAAQAASTAAPRRSGRQACGSR